MKRVLWKLALVFLVALIYTVYCEEEHGFCERTVDGVKCLDKEEIKLTRLEGREVGDETVIDVGDGQTLTLRTINTKPLLFEIEDFLTEEECDHFIKVAEKTGLESSFTENPGKEKGIRLLDLNNDKTLTLQEMKLTIHGGYDIYLEDEDILTMYDNLGIDKNNDQLITDDELKTIKPTQLKAYLHKLMKEHPEKHSRYSRQAWLFPDQSTDNVFEAVQERVSKVVQLPMGIIRLSDFQVVNYGVKGHYNAHYDSTREDIRLPCCDRGKQTRCKICRYMTVLFYLNHVEGGGETAFPLANNETIDEMRVQMEGISNLYQKCSDANLRVAARKGKAILWYNHLLDGETMWMGEMDKYTLHGGCPITQGEKWIANFWIKATHSKENDIKRMEKVLKAKET